MYIRNNIAIATTGLVSRLSKMSSKLPPNMIKFDRAMQIVYRYPTEASDESWTPPPASAGHKGRYLWTDAFGVLNFVTLFLTTSSPHYLGLARALVDAVHSTLGRTRDGSSQLRNATADAPLAGGLRIGKEEAAGPDGDGQYHHYLTLWMFALNRLGAAARDRRYNDLAVQLAKAVHPAFVYNRAAARPRMYWKVSMDLSVPLVRSEGNLDPIDGFVVYRILQESDGPGSKVLETEIDEYRRIVETKWRGYRSDDPLDLGMTMWTSHFFGSGLGAEKEEWSASLLEAAKRDTANLFDRGHFNSNVRRRLAFREFGTVLGLRCGTEGARWDDMVKKIIDTWESTGVVPDPGAAKADAVINSEKDLVPITLVMYAAALNPASFRTGYHEQRAG